VHLRADDEVSRLRAVWLGPDGTRWPMDWTFTEWAIAAGAALIVGPLSFVLITRAFGLLPGLGFGAAYGAAAGVGAKMAVSPLINSDRRVRYLVRLAVGEGARGLWARGPVDRVAAAVAVPVWLVVQRLGFFLPGLARLAWLVVAVVIAQRVARWAVARFESPERAWRRQVAHAARQAPSINPVLACRVSALDFACDFVMAEED
jgi:hypothetical protein